MTLNDILSATETVRIKHITYGRDGNTVVIHHIDVHPVTDNFYVFRTSPDRYGQYSNVLVAVFPGNYALSFDSISRYNDSEDTLMFHSSMMDEGERMSLEKYVRKRGAAYSSLDALAKDLNERMQDKQHIPLAEIRLFDEMIRLGHYHDASFPVRLCLYKQERMDELEHRRQLREAEREQKAAEQKRLADEKRKADVASLRLKLLEDGEVRIDATSLFLLAKQEKIDFPLRLKGWMRKNLHSVIIQNGIVKDYGYYMSKSTSIMKYLQLLINTLKNSANEGDTDESDQH